MKPIYYLVTWLILLITIPLAVLVTVYGLVVSGKPSLVFNWSAFCGFVKKGDLVK